MDLPWPVWPDEDGDGYGAQVDDPLLVTHHVSGWVANRLDCDDTDPAFRPGASDQCVDGQPMNFDCSGGWQGVDGSRECMAEFTHCHFYVDEDGDSYGGAVAEEYSYMQCYFPENMLAEGLVGDWGDCDDADPLVHPDATETCDTIDNNCDQSIDEGC